MNSKELAKWLSRRRESQVLDRIREHLVHVNGCISKSKDFFQFWLEKDQNAAENMCEIIHQEEKTADRIEAEIVDLLSEGKTPDYVRADLLNFVKLADKAAGSIKRAVKNLFLLINHEFPTNLTKILEKTIDLLSEESVAFIKVYDAMFKLVHEELISEIKVVDELESKIDEQYGKIKYEISYSTQDVPAGALIILDHAVKDIESASDLLEDCADMIRSLVLL